MDKSQETKRIAQNTFFLYIRMGVSMLVSLYTYRIVLEALGFADFGLYGVIGGIVGMFTIINGSLSGTISRYITYAIGKNDKNEIIKSFNTAFAIQIVLCALIVLACETVGLWYVNNKLVYSSGQYSEVAIAYQLSILTTLVPLLIVPFNAMIIAYERMKIFAYFSILDIFMKLGIAFLIQWFPSGRLVYYALFLLVACVFYSMLYVVYCCRNFDIKIQIVRNKKLYKDMMSFASWNFIGNLAWVGYSQGINLLLNLFFGPVVNAARTISVQIESSIRSFASNFQTAINPRIIKSYADNQLEYMHSLIYASAKYSFYLLIFLGLPVLIETPYILKIWLGEYPDYSVSFFRITFAISIIEATSNSLAIGLSATGNIKRYHLVVSSILLSIVPIAYMFLKLGHNPNSVFFIYLTITIIACIAKLVIVAPEISLSKREYFSKVCGRCGIVCVIAMILPITVFNLIDQCFVNFVLVCLTCAVSSIVSIYILGINGSERKFVNDIVRNKISKLKNCQQ